MDLAELVRLRPVPGAGVLFALTQRCPLRCRHCSSSSTMDGPEPEAARALAFVESFARDRAPAVLLMTGGEPLLRPDLVTALAAAARRAGTRSALLTGAFFAAADPVPAPILRAIRAVEHFSVSVDAFHERQVRRRDVLRLLGRVRAEGIAVSVHALAAGADDGYLAGLDADLRRALGGPVPMLVNTVRAIGRATGWATARPHAADPADVNPCAMAAWPVVAPDGTVVACCNQDTVDRRPVPAHLRLGHVDTDDWPTIRARGLASPALRMIRAAGPGYLASLCPPAADDRDAAGTSRTARAGDPAAAGGGSQCATCRRLGPAALEAARGVASGAAGALLDGHAAEVQRAAGPVALLRRYADPRHAHLVEVAR
ncbi:hypothetical protein Val02_47540 [Virgisporangium aliadipatigenens]|uniref:Radical SAM core domain-containing protein n=1 Tax=Virgisporangium aliadipatigenens TaxID=741659 RepID=A0A8J3YPF1_9ACTN|nr:radical SAM protein [Virgisporangium aliadipatigenens]GIJ47868.1 hypothetical protein Val02_47540 [Virgisporangium aliadipatigenens]